jgi:hypothetical protein
MTMADAFEELQLKAIDDAFSERIKSLFGILFTNLLPGTKAADERLCIEHFAAGLQVAQQAREIAIKLANSGRPGPAHGKPAPGVA